MPAHQNVRYILVSTGRVLDYARTMTRYVIYAIWAVLPIFFFVVALWSKLEEFGSKSKKRDDAADFFRQGLFVLICVIISVVIDRFFLEKLVAPLSDFLPESFFRIALLPTILLLAARFVGPSKQIRITKSARPTERKVRK